MQSETAEFAPVQPPISTKQRYLASDWCRHLANWTKHVCRVWFWPTPCILRKHESSAKPEVYNNAGRWEPKHDHILHVQWIWWNLNVCFLRYVSGQTDKQTCKHTDTLIIILHTPIVSSCATAWSGHQCRHVGFTPTRSSASRSVCQCVAGECLLDNENSWNSSDGQTPNRKSQNYYVNLKSLRSFINLTVQCIFKIYKFIYLLTYLLTAVRLYVHT